MALSDSDLAHIRLICVEANVPLLKLVDRVEDHHRALYGNGKPGLTSQVLGLVTRAKVVNKIFWLVVGSVVLVLTPAFFLAVVWMIRNVK